MIKDKPFDVVRWIYQYENNQLDKCLKVYNNLHFSNILHSRACLEIRSSTLNGTSNWTDWTSTRPVTRKSLVRSDPWPKWIWFLTRSSTGLKVIRTKLTRADPTTPDLAWRDPTRLKPHSELNSKIRNSLRFWNSEHLQIQNFLFSENL